jgi:hypothetical protein
LEASALNPSVHVIPRYQIQLTRLDADLQHQVADPMGLSRGRVVGLRTATAFLEADEAGQVLVDWLSGGDGERPTRWSGAVVLQRDEPADAG